MYVPIHMINGLQAGGAEARSWAPAVRAVAAAESYWLEMYPDWIHDANYATWTHGTRAFVKAIERAGGEVGRTHFILGAATGRIDGMPREMCPNGRGCAWKATRATVLNRQISDNGVGLYRVGPTALQVLCVATVEERESLDRATWGIVMRACGRWLRTGEREALRKRAGSMK